MKGIFRLSIFKDIAVVSGCGVGGGSLGYANTLYVPPSPFFEDPQWADLEDWEARAGAPLRDRAADARRRRPRQRRPRRPAAARARRGARRRRHLPQDPDRGLPRQPRARPSPTPSSKARDRSGPAACSAAAAWSAARTAPRTRWSRTTSGWPSIAASRCRPSAPSPTSARSAPPTAATATRSPASAPACCAAASARTLTARGVIVAAGPLGTNKLLQRCRLGGSLPRISPRLGELVRTNSESILGGQGARRTIPTT